MTGPTFGMYGWEVDRRQRLARAARILDDDDSGDETDDRVESGRRGRLAVVAIPTRRPR